MILKIRETLNGFASILGDIAVNETGFVRKRSGFAAAWVVGLLVVGAVVLGMPDRAVADNCPTQVPMDPCTDPVCSDWCYFSHPIWWDCRGECYSPTVCDCYGPVK